MSRFIRFTTGKSMVNFDHIEWTKPFKDSDEEVGVEIHLTSGELIICFFDGEEHFSSYDQFVHYLRKCEKLAGL